MLWLGIPRRAEAGMRDILAGLLSKGGTSGGFINSALKLRPSWHDLALNLMPRQKVSRQQTLSLV
jgi:hypothetical protein